MKKYVPLIARILLSIIFILSGLFKIIKFQDTQQFMASVGMPATAFLLAVALIIEILGGLSLLFGYKTKLGAYALFIFVLIATLIFHTNFTDQNQMSHFLKNLAIMGGLLLLAYYGPNEYSVDKK